MDVIPFWMPGSTLTCHAEAAVVGGTFVDITGPTVGGNPQVSTATAAAKAVGVAAFDGAIDAKVTVFAAPGVIVPMLADGAIAAGAEVEVGATGKAKAFSAGVKVGVAFGDAAGTPSVVMVKLY